MFVNGFVGRWERILAAINLTVNYSIGCAGRVYFRRLTLEQSSLPISRRFKQEHKNNGSTMPFLNLVFSWIKGP